MSDERRRTPRAPCNFPVQWKRGWRTVDAQVRDLNADGLFMQTDQTIELNQMVDLIITLPQRQISMFGIARFVGKTRYGHGIGVAIHTMSFEDRVQWNFSYRAALQELVQSLPTAIARHVITE